MELAQAQGRFVRLREALQKATDYDYIIIDSPPSLSLLTVNGMIAANYVLLPVQAEFTHWKDWAAFGKYEIDKEGA